MATLLIVSTSVVGGLLLIGLVFFLAYWPELRAQPRKSRLAQRSGDVDRYPYDDPGSHDQV